MNKPDVEIIDRKELDARRKKIIHLYGTINDLREKDSNGTITPSEATALEDLEGFDFLEQTR